MGDAFLQSQVVMKGAEFYRAGRGGDAVNGGAERLRQPVVVLWRRELRGFLSILYSVCFLQVAQFEGELASALVE